MKKICLLFFVVIFLTGCAIKSRFKEGFEVGYTAAKAETVLNEMDSQQEKLDSIAKESLQKIKEEKYFKDYDILKEK